MTTTSESNKEWESTTTTIVPDDEVEEVPDYYIDLDEDWDKWGLINPAKEVIE